MTIRESRSAAVRFLLSVVVNTMGRLETLKPCIAGLRQQYDAVFDVTVVVGPGSTDTWEWLSHEHPDVRLVDCPVSNLAASRNLGWRHASGDLIAFIDDDATPLPGWLNSLALPFAEPRVAAAGGFVLDHTGARHQWQFLTIDPLCNPIEVRAVDYKGPAIAYGPLDPKLKRFSYPPGTNMMFRRRALEFVGGFDENYAYAADDAELTLRLYEKGWGIAHVPEAEVLHRYAPSHQRVNGRIPRSLLDTVRSFVHFKFKHGTRHYPTDVVLSSVQSYLAQIRQWVDHMASTGQIDAAHASRLRSEIEEGAADAVRRTLAPRAVANAFTGGVKISRSPSVFTVTRPLSRQLRVCLVAKEMPPGPSGGIGVWVRTLGKYLAKLGHETHLVAGGAGSASMEWIDGCWLHRAPTPEYAGRTWPRLEDLPPFIRRNAWRVFDTVTRLEAQRPFDFVCAPIWEAQGIGLQRARRGISAVSLHTPMRTVIRTSRTWKPDVAWFHEYGDPLMAAEGELASGSGFVLANSQSVVEEIEREYQLRIRRDRLAIIPHGVEDPGSIEEECRGVHPMRKLLFVGRFEGRKGIDILLEALPRLMEQHRDLIVDLVGEHRVQGLDGRTMLEAFRAKHAGSPWLDRVRTPGMVTDAAVLAAYRSCDVFVAPSRFESFGLIYLEAMRFGKPVVALDVGGAREIIRQGVNGLLVQGESSVALANAIDRLLHDEAFRRAIGRAARADFERNYTAQKMAERVAEAIMRRLHGKPMNARKELNPISHRRVGIGAHV